MFFNIKDLPSPGDNGTIAWEGTRIGTFERPLTFVLTSASVQTPYTITFLVRQRDQPALSFQISAPNPLASEFSVNIPTQNSPYWNLVPAKIIWLVEPPVQLCASFVLYPMAGTNQYLVYLVFYEQKFSPPPVVAPDSV